MNEILYISLAVIALIVLITLAIKHPLRAYRRKRKYEKIVQHIHRLFALTDPFLLSQEERQLNQQPDLYYGEVDVCAFLDLLAIINPKPKALLVDLGSGCGKLVIAAKLGYPTLNVRGIEILNSLHQMGKLKYQELVDQKLIAGADGVSFVCEDFLQSSLDDADVIMLNATAYTDETFAPVLQKLLELKPATKVIITSKQLPAESFKKIYQGMEKTSWGLTSMFVYEKLQ